MTIYDLAEDPRNYYIISEFIEGESPIQRLKSSMFSEKETLEIVK